MATPRQIEANRRNAQKSTGPKTPEGKQAVSLNSLRHGLRAATVVLPREDAAEFQRLCDDLEAEWQPQTRTEQIYVEQMAIAYWKLQRLELIEARTLSEGLSDLAPVMLERVWQAQQRQERSFARAQHDLERIQKSRGTPHPATAMASVSAEGPVGQAIVPAAAFQAAPGALEPDPQSPPTNGFMTASPTRDGLSSPRGPSAPCTPSIRPTRA
jgi:hypothetical protein